MYIFFVSFYLFLFCGHMTNNVTYIYNIELYSYIGHMYRALKRELDEAEAA